MMVFDHKIHLISLKETTLGCFSWETERKLWAHPKRQTRRNLFFKAGPEAVSVLFSMHPQPVTLHQAIQWEGRNYLLTAVNRKSPVLQEVCAAEVEHRGCTVSRPIDQVDDLKRPVPGMEERLSFPGVLIEKYKGYTYAQLLPHAQYTESYVLITPKVVRLEVGEIVEIGGGFYAVRVPHVLDPFKNKYEVHRKVDA